MNNKRNIYIIIIYQYVFTEYVSHKKYDINVSEFIHSLESTQTQLQTL